MFEESCLSRQTEEKQFVPVWSVYNYLHHTSDPACIPCVKDKAAMMPIINAAAQDWFTLIAGLTQLWDLQLIILRSPVTVTLDIDLYKQALN